MTDKIIKALTVEHNVKMTGAVMLYITGLIKDRNIALLQAIDAAKEVGVSKEMIQTLEQSSEAATMVGCVFLDAIEKAFGSKWLDKYLNDEAEIPKPPEITPSILN